MAEPYMSEIRMFSSNFAPKGWALCDGQLLPINQNQALFSLLGTTYGGNGQTNFALPDLRGRVPMHMGAGFTLGEVSGTETVTLQMSEMPAHTHLVAASGADATLNSPAGNVFAVSPGNVYENSGGTPLMAPTITNTGGSQPHENRQPLLAITFCIALQGIFPSQN
jgi:microcystin-dependent protein